MPLPTSHNKIKPKNAMGMIAENLDEELKDKVINRLKTVYDPEIPVDIYELGLIYEVKKYPVDNLFVLMTLTSPNCPSAGEIPDMVKEALSTIEGINDIQVEITFDPPYDQEMMSEAAKLELGFM